MITAAERVYSIKVRKVSKINIIDLLLFGKSYYFNKMEKVRILSLPNDGERIKITWFPDNRGVTNAYIGWEGIVEKMRKDKGTFCLNSGTAILICHGNFNYIKL